MAKGSKPRRKKKNRWKVFYKESLPNDVSFSEITAHELRVTDAGALLFLEEGDPRPLFAVPPQAYSHVERIDL